MVNNPLFLKASVIEKLINNYYFNYLRTCINGHYVGCSGRYREEEDQSPALWHLIGPQEAGDLETNYLQVGIWRMT